MNICHEEQSTLEDKNCVHYILVHIKLIIEILNENNDNPVDYLSHEIYFI